MKKFVAFLFVGMLSASVLSANEVRTQQSVSGLQSQDVEFLFGNNVKASDLNIAVLSEEELKETQGEFWGFVGQTFASWGLSKIFDEIFDDIFK
ncbi:hypothetical protein ACWIWK_03005 [Helicobacter sp. 23-1048]